MNQFVKASASNGDEQLHCGMRSRDAQEDQTDQYRSSGPFFAINFEIEMNGSENIDFRALFDRCMSIHEEIEYMETGSRECQVIEA